MPTLFRKTNKEDIVQEWKTFSNLRRGKRRREALLKRKIDVVPALNEAKMHFPVGRMLFCGVFFVVPFILGLFWVIFLIFDFISGNNLVRGMTDNPARVMRFGYLMWGISAIDFIIFAIWAKRDRRKKERQKPIPAPTKEFVLPDKPLPLKNRRRLSSVSPKNREPVIVREKSGFFSFFHKPREL